MENRCFSAQNSLILTLFTIEFYPFSVFFFRLPPSPLVCRELVISEHFSGENSAESAIFRLKNGKITEKRTENGENGPKITENGSKMTENGPKTTENGSKMPENGSKMAPNATFAADFLRKHELDPEMHHKTGFTVNSIRELYKGASFARKILSGCVLFFFVFCCFFTFFFFFSYTLIFFFVFSLLSLFFFFFRR
jgi:hypothetical protein